ncbi:MAG: tripartite tricarboxylate transporter substrate binding protein [Betaproteobacteria bacterium]|nr:tripartite tricarboxylate transporter substrate binding protein [Betaproteobacteria bacterium]
MSIASSIRRRLAAVALGAVALSSCGGVLAQDWPTRPVRLINPFTAGSAVDVVARLIAARLSQNVNVQFIVENRTGASGNIGTEVAARARPDGETFLVGSPGTMAINPWLFKSLPYDAEKDFVAVTVLVSFPQVMVVNPKIPATTVAEFAAWVKGQQGRVNFASSGQGSTSHLVMELIRAEAKLDMTHIPFRGGSPAVQAVIAGDVQVAVEGLPSLPGHLAAGTIRPLAVTSERRSDALPNVPALSETYPGFDAAAWVILFAPAGTPTAIVNRMAAEVKKSLEAPEVQERLAKMGATPSGLGPAETAAFHKRELSKFKRAVEISGAKAEQ